jgi:hypothetical protein
MTEAGAASHCACCCRLRNSVLKKAYFGSSGDEYESRTVVAAPLLTEQRFHAGGINMSVNALLYSFDNQLAGCQHSDDRVMLRYHFFDSFRSRYLWYVRCRDQFSEFPRPKT